MTPMNILEIAIRPTSLCMRLFGNVLGAFVIMELIKLVVPVFVPAVFSLYFDLFDGLIQTYVFVFLTSLFMKESLGDEENLVCCADSSPGIAEQGRRRRTKEKR